MIQETFSLVASSHTQNDTITIILCYKCDLFPQDVQPQKFCWRPGYTLGTARDNDLMKQTGYISNAASNTDKDIVQQGDTKRKQFGNKEQ